MVTYYFPYKEVGLTAEVGVSFLLSSQRSNLQTPTSIFSKETL